MRGDTVKQDTDETEWVTLYFPPQKLTGDFVPAFGLTTTEIIAHFGKE